MVGNPPAKSVPDLPSSKNVKFWGKDARIELIPVIKGKAKKTHFPIYQQGPYFICRGCPQEHTIPGFSHLTHTVIDGKIVKKDHPLDSGIKKQI